MWRYKISNNPQHLTIQKRWTAYLTEVGQYGVIFVFLAILLIYHWLNPHTNPIRAQLSVLMSGMLTALAGIMLLYQIGRTLRPGNSFLFNARLRMFECRGHVISHWDGISTIRLDSIAHRFSRYGFGRRRYRNLQRLEALWNQTEIEDYYYTYRVSVLLANGKSIMIDECADRAVIEALAQEIAEYVGRPLNRNLDKNEAQNPLLR